MKPLTSSCSLKSTSASSGFSDNTLHQSITIFPDYDDLVFIKKLSETKFPVYLVRHTKTSHYYAMKIFPWEENEPSPFFIKEIRFAEIIAHPNIISVVYFEYEQTDSSPEDPVKFSYILMEYAKHGDFIDLLSSSQIVFNDILIRTYFRQIISGTEALHSQGGAHLDLKLENLLLTEDFALKITDFDLSYLPEDGVVQTKGTKNFRAPEILEGTCIDPQAADIYSLGIILFMLKTGGMLPFIEDDLSSMKELKSLPPKAFWEKQCELLRKKPSFFSEDFKSLFMWMIKPDPQERPTLTQVKRSAWYNKEVYSEEELSIHMYERLCFNE